MALGVSMARNCPDQSGTEAARKAYVAEALKQPASTPTPKRAATGPQQSYADKLRADEARRIAGGFVRGGHR